MGSIPGSGRSPGGGHGNPLQYSCLKNPMDRGAWRAAIHGAAKSRTRLSGSARRHVRFTHHTLQFKCSKQPQGLAATELGGLGVHHLNAGSFLVKVMNMTRARALATSPPPWDFFTALLTPPPPPSILPSQPADSFLPIPSSASSSWAPPSGKAPGNSRSSTSLLQSRAAFPGSAHRSLLPRAQGALPREAELPSASLVLLQGSLTFPVNFILTFGEQELGSGKPCVLSLLGF